MMRERESERECEGQRVSGLRIRIPFQAPEREQGDKEGIERIHFGARGLRPDERRCGKRECGDERGTARTCDVPEDKECDTHRQRRPNR